MIKKDYVNDSICPYLCLYKIVRIKFVNITVYVDNINLIATLEKFIKTIKLAKKIWDERFKENKILSRSIYQTQFKWILIYQLAYILTKY